ncbi:TPA: hypothetical protein QHX34_002721 [Klebsiella aerogenes]|nr:hypothetical protein [Klebsiella aerogenes]
MTNWLKNKATLETFRNIIRDSLLGVTFITLLVSEVVSVWGSSTTGLFPKIILTIPLSAVILTCLALIVSLMRIYLIELTIKHKIFSGILIGVWILTMEVTLIFSIVNFIHKI